MDQQLKCQFNVFPNPVSDRLFIEVAIRKNLGLIKLKSLDGRDVTRLVNFSMVNDTVCEINLSLLTKGVYVLEFNDEKYRIQKN